VRILYVAVAHDYGQPELGPSFEETNFRSALEGMGHELVRFDFTERERAVGRSAMNGELVRLAGSTRPDLAFFVLFREELSPETIRAVGHEGGAPTMNWFADDHWRFDSFSRHYAPAFDWVVTTDHEAVSRYRAIGHDRVILSQWACNRYAYGKVTSELEHDVTFVGQAHGSRGETMAELQRSGIRVECWGRGWPAGRLGHEEMVRVFSSSRINLNLSNASEPQRGFRARVGALVRGIDMGPRRSQIKGRIFEVPGCGGFLLTDRVPYLEQYFELGSELDAYDSPDELPDRIEYWLSHPDERAAVAEAGFRRVLAEHTYDHRFAEIFRAAGLA
jgi:spore maturation protein CgeB